MKNITANPPKVRLVAPPPAIQLELLADDERRVVTFAYDGRRVDFTRVGSQTVVGVTVYQRTGQKVLLTLSFSTYNLLFALTATDPMCDAVALDGWILTVQRFSVSKLLQLWFRNPNGAVYKCLVFDPGELRRALFHLDVLGDYTPT
jgi:hypothetical protein